MKNRKYVFYWGKEDYYANAFSEIINWDNVDYIDSLPVTSGTAVKWLHKVHNSSKINRVVSLPLKQLWFSKYTCTEIPENSDVFFVFHASYYWLRRTGYFTYIKNKNPRAKMVFVLMDTVNSYINYFKYRFADGFDMNYIKESFDLVITYNKLDAVKYDLIYYPSIYSSSSLKKNAIKEQYDVFFIGRAKDRLNELIKAYEILNEKGMSCLFYISDVNDADKKYDQSIIYNKYLSYDEVIDCVNQSRGVLEIVQKDSCGFTFRLDEALIYDKNIITDNKIIEDFPFKNSTKIFRYNEIGRISKDKYRRAANESFDYDGRYAPSRFIGFLDGFFAKE